MPGYHIEDQQPGHEEVRPPGRQGAGARGRADQAPQRRALPARRHGRARHRRRAHRRRGGDAARRPRRRARPAVHPRRHQRRAAVVQGRLPGAAAPLPCARRRGAQRPPALRDLGRAEYAAADAWLERNGPRGARLPKARGRLPRRRRSAGRRRARRGRIALPRGLGGRGRPRDLRRGRRRGARVPRRRGRGARDEPGRVARVRPHRVVLRRRARRRNRSGIRIVWDCEHAKTPGGLLPDPRRHRLRDRQVAGGGALRRPALDGDQDRRPRTTPAASPRRSTPSIPDKMLAYNLSPSFNWDIDRHERRRDAPLPRRARPSWASSSTSSPTAATRSTASPPRSSPPRCARTACSRWPGCSGSSAWSSRPTARRRRWSAARASTPRWPPPPAAPRPPRRWARARRSTSTWCRPRCRRSCSRSGWRSGAGTTASTEQLRVELRPQRAGSELLELGDLRRRQRREARQRGLRADPGPPRPQHPLGARPEHVRRDAAQEAADDARPPLPDPPLQGSTRCTTSRRPRTTSTRRRR